jgi:phytoene synthase
VTPPDAYDACERIVRRNARNFSYGIRLLPPPKRRALSAVYAFARRIDDIGDGGGPVADRLTRLSGARAALRHIERTEWSADAPREYETIKRADERACADALHENESATVKRDPVLVALGDAARRFPIPFAAFEELIDGCAADVRGETYEVFDDLLAYCRQVAGSIGRLSLGVFGVEDTAAATPYADALGVALQLTNVLRDLREDRANGRVYLPAEDLKRFGCALELGPSGAFADPPGKLAELMRFEAARTLEWYRRGTPLFPLLDRRSAACAAAMTGIYRRLLDRIAKDPAAALAERSSLPAWQKAAVAARALIGAGR